MLTFPRSDDQPEDFPDEQQYQAVLGIASKERAASFWDTHGSTHPRTLGRDEWVEETRLVLEDRLRPQVESDLRAELLPQVWADVLLERKTEMEKFQARWLAAGLTEANLRTIIKSAESARLLRSESVYFIREHTTDSDAGYVKIGYSDTSIESRRRSLQSGNPRPLVTMFAAKGSVQLERLLHRTLSHVRGSGEWFVWGPEVRLVQELLSVLGVGWRK